MKAGKYHVNRIFFEKGIVKSFALINEKKPTVERSAVSLQYSKLGGELYLA